VSREKIRKESRDLCLGPYYISHSTSADVDVLFWSTCCEETRGKRTKSWSKALYISFSRSQEKECKAAQPWLPIRCIFEK
jgi:hypothetical protein